ncbi:uncharacterized protein LOC110695002 [Chenopodium quinoa]|uniref:uncharacterized protein LOC110695002 n=1 Tax=Chenopodium quinoa TaxID=63459 RepID=UPI000B776F6A|nr:uncharacterized protein LOC110695002 [Chenopodium quinoa]
MSKGNRKRTFCDVLENVVGEEEDGFVLSNKVVGTPREKTIELYSGIFKDDRLTYGGLVKARGEVMLELATGRRRPHNMSCQIDSFGRICQKFDDRRRRWVCEMGFGGILQLAFNMQLPRQLAYWLMTRIDPLRKMLITPDGVEFRLSKKQVRWVLGIPMGTRSVPSTKTMSVEDREKVQRILLKYGKAWESNGQRGRVYMSVGIPLSSEMMDRLEGHFDGSEEEEFKTFLIIALEMVLCPTKSARLAADLLPAIGCAMEANEYDWCGLVLSKFIGSVSSFA